MEKEEKKKLSCEIVNNIGSIKIDNIQIGLLNSIKLCFDKKPKRHEIEKIKTNLRMNKISHVFGEKCLLIR
ncbi:MAG TPA: hypothetical protein VGB37_00670 [Candidatus Lokiarchaeia archaeon]